jgi:hypothetical protein
LLQTQGDQSAFTNFSVFDRNYLVELFGTKVFPNGELGITMIEGFLEHQKIFLEEFSRIKGENLFGFPVVTISLLYQDGKFVDEDFAKWACEHNRKWNDSNLFLSGELGILSSCPLDGDTEILYWNSETNSEDVASIEKLYKTNNTDYVLAYHYKNYIKCKINKFKEKPNYEIETEDGAIIRTTANHLNKVYGENYVRTKDLKVGDKLPINLIEKSKLIWTKIKSINIIETDKSVAYCLEVLEDVEPVFTLGNGIMTHNCRVTNDTKQMPAFINSIGGTALSIGSVKVNTINLKRIAIESGRNQDKFMEILEKRMTLVMKVLKIIRKIITRNIEKGLLTNYVDGCIDMEKQFCTIGM